MFLPTEADAQREVQVAEKKQTNVPEEQRQLLLKEQDSCFSDPGEWGRMKQFRRLELKAVRCTAWSVHRSGLMETSQRSKRGPSLHLFFLIFLGCTVIEVHVQIILFAQGIFI